MGLLVWTVIGLLFLIAVLWAGAVTLFSGLIALMIPDSWLDEEKDDV